MVRRPLLRALTAALAVVLVGAQPALARVNEFAASQTQAAGSQVFDGLKGNMGIRTDPATVVGVAYVHITQADVGAFYGDFVAIGTVNGMGTSGGIHNCASDYDAQWNGYYDGESGGVYWCYNFGLDAWGAGSNPSFKIQYTTCPGAFSAWVLTFDGATRDCESMGTAAASRLIVGLETVTASNPADPTDRNIDVKYTYLKRNQTNGTDWIDLGKPGASDWIIYPNYDYDWVSNTAQNFYKPPLN